MTDAPRIARRAELALERGNWLKAVDLLRTELARHPCFHSAVVLATIYLEHGRFHMAEELVDQAFSWADMKNPLSVCPVTDAQRRLYLLKANLRLSLGDAQGALSLYTVLLSERPADADLLYRMGLAYERMGQRELAIGYLDRAIAAHPDFLPAMEIKGQILLVLKRLPEALDLYTEVTLAHPGNVNAYCMLGHIYHRMQRPVAAVYAWERAVALAPNADEPLRMLAKAALGRGDLAQARDYLTRAVTANPRNVHAHLDLADLLDELGETRSALAHWDEAERLFPGHPRLQRCKERRERVAWQITGGRSPLDFFVTGEEAQRPRRGREGDTGST